MESFLLFSFCAIIATFTSFPPVIVLANPFGGGGSHEGGGLFNSDYFRIANNDSATKAQISVSATMGRPKWSGGL
jgi:hypothetical protein